MRLLTWFSLSGLVACSQPKSQDSARAVDSNTDLDTHCATLTDADAQVWTDGGGCVELPSGLMLCAEVRTDSGACTECPSNEDGYYAALVVNSTERDLVFHSARDCILHSFTTIDRDSGVVSPGLIIGWGTATELDVPAGQSLEYVTAWGGPMPAGNFTLRATFGDGNKTEPEVDFEVQG